MTTATTKTRQRRAKATARELMPRGQHLLDQGADFLILSARMAETPEPKFWAKGELDSRTTLAVPADADYDDNYRRVFEDPWWDWNWYRDALLADELAAVPVCTITVADDDPELTLRVNELMGKAAEQFPEDVPGPDGALLPPGVPETRTEDPPPGAAGPGTQDDPALD